ncbi:hypothetical protein MMC21_008219 [Puttea exsequens]|nr:hypothetical protein [Puttea exsequens]
MSDQASDPVSEQEASSGSSSKSFQSAQRSETPGLAEQKDLILENEDDVDAYLGPATRNHPSTQSFAAIEGLSTDEGEKSDASAALAQEHEHVLSPPLAPTRPNRFPGSASTWRNRTALMRDLNTSLDQLLAKDLGIHLFNDFKLRQGGQSRPSRIGSEQKDEANEAAKWKPPKIWTAWPLPPDIVPREEDERHWEERGGSMKLRRARMPKSSEVMRELLLAQLLRKAKQQFTEWHREGAMVKSCDEVHMGPRLVVMADDERASDILRLSIQHILTKLDDLLMGLHHSRSGYLGKDVDKSESHSRSRGRGRSVSQASKKNKKRNRDMSRGDSESARPSSASPDTYSEDNQSRARFNSKNKTQRSRSFSRSSSQSSRQRQKRLGLRDWSDVLGIASLAGWDANAVQRAAARCSTLFEEGMAFRAFDEADNVGFTDRLHLPGASLNMAATGREDAEVRKREEDLDGGVHVDGFLQPIQGKKSWRYERRAASTGRPPGRPRKPKP